MCVCQRLRRAVCWYCRGSPALACDLMLELLKGSTDRPAPLSLSLSPNLSAAPTSASATLEKAASKVSTALSSAGGERAATAEQGTHDAPWIELAPLEGSSVSLLSEQEGLFGSSRGPSFRACAQLRSREGSLRHERASERPRAFSEDDAGDLGTALTGDEPWDDEVLGEIVRSLPLGERSAHLLTEKLNGDGPASQQTGSDLQFYAWCLSLGETGV